MNEEDKKRIAERKARRAADKRTKPTYGKEGRRYYER
jgi:hypothetical protein